MLRSAALAAACLCAVQPGVARAANDDRPAAVADSGTNSVRDSVTNPAPPPALAPAAIVAPPAATALPPPAESIASRGANPLNTPAQSFVRKLPADTLKAPAPRRFASGDYVNPRTAILMDEIRVYGQVEPEDFVRRKQGAMAPLRARLENDRPMTPADKVKLALCFVGLCGVYSPDGLPREPSLDERNDARTNQSTTQLNSQFRGALQ